MKIIDIIKSGHPAISFEFFPPKSDEGLKNLFNTIAALKPLAPSYVSVTYGAGGSTRSTTVSLVSKIKKEIGIETMAHLTCVGHTKDEIKGVLDELQNSGVENVLALRGDPPKGQSSFVPTKGGFAHASDLVAFMKSHYSFGLGVAGYPEKHPEAPNLDTDIHHLKDKIGKGADFVITQLFFSNEDYYSFVQKLRTLGLSVPVIPGIMPITDLDQIRRFAFMCGAKMPKSLLAQLELAGGDKAKVVRIGIEHATSQCSELLARGVPGLHFYTLNKSEATKEIFQRLKSSGAVS